MPRVRQDGFQQGALWTLLAIIVVGVVLVIIFGSRGDDWCTRSLGDPVVATHLMGIIPLALAIYFRMPLTAIVVFLSLVTSLFYHLFCENNSQKVLNYVDVFFAHFVLFLFIVILFVAVTLRADEYLLSFSFVLAVIAIVMWFLPRIINKDDACLWKRMHALWHLVAFVAMSLILLAFDRRNIPKSAYSAHSWLRDLQYYHF